jgi:tetratricopeptide (TPR) repeat protein
LMEHESPQEALVWLDRGLEELAGADPLEEAILHLRQGSALIATGNYSAARSVIEESLRLLPEGPSDWRASAYMKLGVIHCSQGDIERGKDYWLQALEIYERFGNIRGTVGVLHDLGIEMEIAGDWAGAAVQYQKALDLAERVGSMEHRTDLELSLGILLTKQGDSESALAHLSQCLELGRSYNLREYIAACRASLADLWIRLAEWDNAETSLIEAEKLAHELDTKYQLPEIYYEWAQIRLARGVRAMALENAERSVQLARDLHSDLNEGIGLRILGQTLLADHRRADALAALAQSLALLEGRDPYEAARTKTQWGAILRAGGDVNRGAALLHEARATFETLGARRELETVDKILQ